VASAVTIDDDQYQLRRLPLSARDYSTGDLALSPVHLSFRDVEDLLAERGIMVSYETLRRWVNHFGPKIAADLRKRRPKPHTKRTEDGCSQRLFEAMASARQSHRETE
jgi:hypothetical protein